MLNSMNLPDLVRAVSKQESEKKDYLVDTDRVAVRTTLQGQSLLRLPIGREFTLAETARMQIADRLEVPFRYLEHLRAEHPNLFDSTVNTLFKSHNETRLIRTLGDNCRAFLSPKYRILDNYQFIGTFLPLLAELPDAEVHEAYLSETHLHISVILRQTRMEVKPNDIVRFGVILGNSEVGLGSLTVLPFIHRLVCSNGLIAQETDGSPVRKVHLGRRISDLSMLPNEREVWLAYAEQIRTLADRDRFPQIVNRLRLASSQMVTSSPEDAIEDLAKKHQLSKDESEAVLNRFVTGEDLSIWGLVNAVTETAKLASTSQRKVELQTIGGKLLPIAA